MVVMFAVLVSAAQLGTMVSLLAGRVGFSGIFPVSIGVALVVGCVLLHQAGFDQSSLWFAGGLFCLTIILSLAVSAFFFDFSWDGQWYHQTAIIHIARSWNPLSDPMHNFAPHLETWERHYAKGPWYFAAAVYQMTGHVEWGKAINWIALAASFSAVLAACLGVGMRRLDAFGIATVIAFNPVVMSEVTTYLVDAVMISFVVVAASALFTRLIRPSVPVIAWREPLYAPTRNSRGSFCFALAAGLIWCALRQRRWLLKYIGVTGASLFLAVCVWGFNPYPTNIYYRGQAFYPIDRLR